MLVTEAREKQQILLQSMMAYVMKQARPSHVMGVARSS